MIKLIFIKTVEKVVSDSSLQTNDIFYK